MPIFKHADFEPPDFAEFAAPPQMQPGYATLVQSMAPVAWWRLGETTGATAADTAGNTPGTFTGGCTLGVAGALARDPHPAARFDGATGHVDCGNTHAALFAGVAPFTIVAWCRITTAIEANPMLVARGRLAPGTSDFQGVQLHFTPFSGTRRVLLRRGGSGELNHVAAETATPWSVNQWHCVVATFDGTTQRVYLDGAAGTPVTGAGVSVGGSSYSAADRRLQLAARDPGSANRLFFPGSLDEIALFSRALSAAEAQTLHRTGIGR